MPTTNFKQWNPPATNQESDAAYNSDTNRANGFPVDGIWPSALANKTLFQISTMSLALAEFIVGQGFDANDTTLATLLTNLTNAIISAAGGGSSPSVIVVAFNSTPGFFTNTKPVCNFQMTLTGNVTSSSIIGVHPGQIVNFTIIQDATGGRTFSSSLPAFGVVDPTPNAASVQSFLVDSGGTFRTLGPMTSS